MKKLIKKPVWLLGVVAICLGAALPSAAQQQTLERSVTRAVASAQEKHDTPNTPVEKCDTVPPTDQVTIHMNIPYEYDHYSCNKLKKMQQNGTLPPATVTTSGRVKAKVEEVKVYKRPGTVTITIPQEYNKYSCRKLKKMQKNGTLPHITVTRTNE